MKMTIAVLIPEALVCVLLAEVRAAEISVSKLILVCKLREMMSNRPCMIFNRLVTSSSRVIFANSSTFVIWLTRNVICLSSLSVFVKQISICVLSPYSAL